MERIRRIIVANRDGGWRNKALDGCKRFVWGSNLHPMNHKASSIYSRHTLVPCAEDRERDQIAVGTRARS